MLIHNQEIIPADGIVVNGIPALDYSFVSGESEIVYGKPGDPIYAGAKQTGSNIEIKVTKPVSQSYLTSLWNKDIFKKKIIFKNRHRSSRTVFFHLCFNTRFQCSYILVCSASQRPDVEFTDHDTYRCLPLRITIGFQLHQFASIKNSGTK